MEPLEPCDYNQVRIESLEPCVGASGGIGGWWPEPEEKGKRKKKMAKSAEKTYKVVVKNGDTKYTLNKSGQYITKTVDYVEEFDSFAAALEVFTGYVIDQHGEEQASLVVVPAKRKKS